MCIYGMEGRAAINLSAARAQVWNTYRPTPEFQPGKTVAVALL